MNTDKHGSKAELRQHIRAALEKISPAVRAVESIGLCDRLEAQLRSAHTILFFAPLPDELDVWPLLEKFLAAGKICALPFFDSATQTYSARRFKIWRRTFPSGNSASASRQQAARKSRWRNSI